MSHKVASPPGSDELNRLRRLRRAPDARVRARARIAWQLLHGSADAAAARRCGVSSATVRRLRLQLAARGIDAVDKLPPRGRRRIEAAPRRQRVLAAFRALRAAAPHAWPSVRAVAQRARVPRSSTYRLLLELALAAPRRERAGKRRKKFNPPS